MPGPDLTSFDPMLKDAQLMVVDARQKENYLYTVLKEKAQVKTVGQTFEEPYLKAFSEGTGTGTRGSTDFTIAAARAVQSKKITGTITPYTARIRIPHMLEAMAANNSLAYVRPLAQEMEGIALASQAEAEIFAAGDGGATERTKVLTATASDEIITVVVDSANKYDTYKIRPNMLIDGLGSNHVALGSCTSLVVKDVVDETTFTITCADAGTAATVATNLQNGSALIYHAGQYNTEPRGLKYAYGVDHSTYFSADRSLAEYAFLRPYEVYVDEDTKKVTRGTSTTLTDWDLPHFQKVVDFLTRIKGCKEPDMSIMCDSRMKAQLIRLWQAYGETHAPEDVDAWPYKEIKFANIPVIDKCKVFPSNTFCIFDHSQIWRLVTRELDWWEFNGSKWYPLMGSDLFASEAAMVGMEDFYSYAPWRGSWFHALKDADDI